MSTCFKASFTQCDIFTVHAFINCLTSLNLFQLTSIAIIIKLFSHFFIYHLLFMFVLFLSNLTQDFWWFLIATKWAFYCSAVFHFVFCPLSETLEVKTITTNCGAGGGGIIFYDLHMANGA